MTYYIVLLLLIIVLIIINKYLYQNNSPYDYGYEQFESMLSKLSNINLLSKSSNEPSNKLLDFPTVPFRIRDRKMNYCLTVDISNDENTDDNESNKDNVKVQECIEPFSPLQLWTYDNNSKVLTNVATSKILTITKTKSKLNGIPVTIVDPFNQLLSS